LNKAYVLAMVMICFNLVLIWFNAMEFFSYQPSGVEGISYNTGSYGFSDIIISGFLITGLTSLAILFAARFVQINAFAMILFTNIFWIPYLATVKIFQSVLQNNTPEAFWGIFTIFTGIMLFIFAYALIEMSNSSVVSG